LHFSGVTITLAPVWSYFFWGYMALAVANTAASAANLFSPYWTLGRATTRLATDSIGAVLFCWMLKANILVGITVANIAPEKTNHLVAAINWWIEKMFPFAIVACAVIVAVSAYRVLRVRAKSRSGVVFNAPCGIPR
jgi:peptidoglycan biosynthesis protein MviN/MurJ (putative lipid II flippase)